MRSLWRFPDLVDFEYFLQRDSEKPEDAVAARDRTIYRRFIAERLAEQRAGTPRYRRAVLRCWLEQRRAEHRATLGEGAVLPGTAATELWMLLRAVALALAFTGGAAAAWALLRYEGTQPINVAFYLAAFVLVQLVLLAGLLLLAGLRLAAGLFRKRVGVGAGLGRLLLNGGLRFKAAVLERLPARERSRWTAALGALRLQGHRYRAVFYWPMFLLGQLIGVGFNLGVLAATLARVFSSDLAFGWQSTVQLSTATAYRIVQALAWPWSWIVAPPTAHPVLDQIEGSRLVLKEGIYRLATQDLVSWWPFLCLAVLCYGLLPRVILFGAGKLGLGFSLRRLRFDDDRFERLLRRMQKPVVTMAGAMTAAGEAVDASAGPDRHRQPPTGDEPQAEICVLLVAEEIVDDLSAEKIAVSLRRRLGLVPAVWLPVAFDFDADEAGVSEALTRMSARGSQPDLVVLQEAWQPPIEETLAFFQKLVRLQVDPAKLWIVLAGRPASDGGTRPAAEADCRVWRAALHRLGNPAVRAVRFEENGKSA